MASKTKLLLIACSGGGTADLTQKIYQILKEDYNLGEELELLLSQRRKEVDPESAKGYRSPLITDHFADSEVQADIGKNELKDVIRGKHIALVEHLLTPVRKVNPDSGNPQTVSVNDHIMNVRGLLNVFSEVDTLQHTLIAPYFTYVRSHSVEKYRERGLHQFDSLRLTIKDYSKDGLNTIITIDPHSEKAAQIAGEMNMDFHGINPFHSGRTLNPYKLGFNGEKAKEMLPRLRPFHERLMRLKEEFKEHIYIVSIDDGTEARTENFAERFFSDLEPLEAYARIAYLSKDRVTYDESVTKFKDFSQIDEACVDPEGVYIIIDDMVSSLGSAAKAAKILKSGKTPKKRGAKRVETWTSHAVTMPSQYEKANDRAYVDKVACLDTVPQPPEFNVEFIPASADLLAAELYKAHHKLKAGR